MRQTLMPAVVAVALLACTPGGNERRQDGAAGGTAETGMSGDTASTGTATGAGEASLSGIFSRLELANTAEIETGKLATSQAQSPAVKRIAQRLVSEHTRNRDELEGLARQKGADLLPRAGGSTARDTAGVLALKGLEGAEFDSAYVGAQIEAHQANIDAIQNQMLPAAQDQEVQRYLQQTVAAMRKHLASLEQVQTQLES
jgi:putative membrane protein